MLEPVNAQRAPLAGLQSLLPLSLQPTQHATRASAEAHHARIKEAIETRYAFQISAVSARWEEAESDFEEARGALGRLPDYWEPPFSYFYWALLALLAIVQTAVAKPAVEALLHLNGLRASLGAAIVAMLMIALAHWAGMLVRRFGRLGAGPLGVVATALALAVLAALIVALSYGVASVGQSAASGLAKWLYVILSLALMSVGVIAAFFRYDADPNYEELDQRRKTAHRKYENLQTRHDRECAAEDRRYARELRRNGW
ncbi:MAG: hypothetical protein JNJ73_04850 [Hyphomonadaceae bacterium]|nr:hypothetical protein [Hyphomonadaceae bacterium]